MRRSICSSPLGSSASSCNYCVICRRRDIRERQRKESAQAHAASSSALDLHSLWMGSLLEIKRDTHEEDEIWVIKDDYALKVKPIKRAK